MIKAAIKINSVLFFLLVLFLPATGNAQEIMEGMSTDTIEVAAPDSLTQAILIAADSVFVSVDSTIVKETPSVPVVPKEAFKPNPTKAVLYALVPGMGQIYNRAYWKLPLVYGGFMGFMYAITWNNKMYQDYLGAYESILIDAQGYQKALDEAGEGQVVEYDFSSKWTYFYGNQDPRNIVLNSSYHSTFKRKKDYFRRYRDLSIILAVGFYAITLIDAYVDAQLFDFDISPDLSMRVEPAFSPQTRYSSRTFGLNCSLTF